MKDRDLGDFFCTIYILFVKQAEELPFPSVQKGIKERRLRNRITSEPKREGSPRTPEGQG